MEEPRWTLDELAERVDAALAVGYAGQSSGRVRAVPDRRAIRWYTTIGLIDRPVAHRGRTALYGPRHLLQLVAVKRLQAKGLPLVAIQQELAGATDTQLARVAHPAPASAAPLAALAPGGGGPRSSPDTPAAPVTTVKRPGSGGRARRGGFWREQPAAFAAAAVPLAPAAAAGPGAVVATLRGVDLGEGTTLLLEPGRELDAADLQAILDAARPLLAVLRERGLDRAAGGPGRGVGPRPEDPPELRREHP
ncbi:MAG TPA: MerR family transcriptional regulator [Actinomycetota bacterium]|nr:MerR family transcriptional regulator [Actinomycetota bacterium]